MDVCKIERVMDQCGKHDHAFMFHSEQGLAGEVAVLS